MLLRVIKSNQVLVQFLLPVLLIGLWWGSFFDEKTLALGRPGPLFTFLFDDINHTLGLLIAMIIILVTGVGINSLVNRNEIFDKTTFVPGALYVILMSCSPEFQSLSPIHCANLFWLLAFRRLLNIYRQVGCKQEMFDAALFISVGALFYETSSIMLILLWLCLLIMRPFVWREWMIPMIAVAGVYLYAYVSFIGFGSGVPFIKVFGWDTGVDSFQISMDFPVSSGLSILGLFVILSLFHFAKKVRRSTIRFRKLSSMMLSFLFVGSIVAFSENIIGTGPVFIIILALPLTLILSFFFMYNKRVWAELLLFYSFLAVVICNIYF